MSARSEGFGATLAMCEILVARIVESSNLLENISYSGKGALSLTPTIENWSDEQCAESAPGACAHAILSCDLDFGPRQSS